MTKFVLSRPGAPWDYATLGFTADADGAILDGTLFDPDLTIPPDAYWSVYEGVEVETDITRYATPNEAFLDPTPEVTAGWVLAYDTDENRFVPTAPTVLSLVWTADTVVSTGDVRQAPDGSWIKSTGNRTTRPSFDTTEATFWEAVLASSGTVEATALTAAIDGANGTVIYVSPDGNDALTGKSQAHPKATLAAALAAVGTGNRGTVIMANGEIDAGAGIDMTGYPVSLLGQGSGNTTIKATTTQTGPVLDFTGVGYGTARVTIGGFTVEGDGIADATNTNKGIAFSPTTSQVGSVFYDILVKETGGSGFDLGAMELCTLYDLVATEPVSAATNDIPWVEASGAFNGNTFHRLGLLSLTLTANVGAGGAVRINDTGYTPHTNKFEDPWCQSLILADGATIFHFEANDCEVAGLQMFDSAKDAGATDTSHVRFAVPTTSNFGGNRVTGTVPGRDTTGNAIDYGVEISQPRNRVVGVKGYRGYNVLLNSGATSNYVELGGAISTATDPAVVDNSGATNNVYIDHVLRTSRRGEFAQDSGTLGVRFTDPATPANGNVFLGTSGVVRRAIGTSAYTDAGNVIFRSIAAANAFAIATDTMRGITFFNIGVALPTAAVGYRGRVVMVQGGAGVADRLVICRKDAADAYAWVDLF